MIQMHPVDIQARDLGEKLTGYLDKYNFQRISLDNIHQLDRSYLESRDKRETSSVVGLRHDQKWRSPEDYLLLNNPEGTLTYVRPNPLAPKNYHTLPFEVHLRTAAPQGFTPQQYFSLALPERNLQLLLKALHLRGDSSISSIADMSESGVLVRLDEQLDEVEGEALPARLFHSTYVSRTREERGGYSNKEKAIEELSRAIGSVIVAAHLFSRKQIAYYEASAEVDKLFSDIALVS